MSKIKDAIYRILKKISGLLVDKNISTNKADSGFGVIMKGYSLHAIFFFGVNFDILGKLVISIYIYIKIFLYLICELQT